MRIQPVQSVVPYVTPVAALGAIGSRVGAAPGILPGTPPSANPTTGVAAPASAPAVDQAGVLRIAAADHAFADMSPEDVQQLRMVLQRMGGSPTGRALLEQLASDKVPIRFAPDHAMVASDGRRAAGMYDPARRTITLAASVAYDTDRAALTLAHEAQHHFDGRFSSPTASLQGEARAFVAEASVASELGLRSNGYGMDARGNVRSMLATIAALKDSSFYARTPLQPDGSQRPTVPPEFWASRVGRRPAMPAPSAALAQPAPTAVTTTDRAAREITSAVGATPAVWSPSPLPATGLSGSIASRTATSFDRTPVGR